MEIVLLAGNSAATSDRFVTDSSNFFKLTRRATTTTPKPPKRLLSTQFVLTAGIVRSARRCECRISSSRRPTQIPAVQGISLELFRRDANHRIKMAVQFDRPAHRVSRRI